jgi:hypothetical protein
LLQHLPDPWEPGQMRQYEGRAAAGVGRSHQTRVLVEQPLDRGSIAVLYEDEERLDAPAVGSAGERARREQRTGAGTSEQSQDLATGERRWQGWGRWHG